MILSYFLLSISFVLCNKHLFAILGTEGIFANVNIDSFHSSSPSQKQNPLPIVWLQNVAPSLQRWVEILLEPPEFLRCQKETVA